MARTLGGQPTSEEVIGGHSRGKCCVELPEGTLKALADHGEVGPMFPVDGGDCEAILTEVAKSQIETKGMQL